MTNLTALYPYGRMLKTEGTALVGVAFQAGLLVCESLRYKRGS
jgi:hypothetical protein